MSSRFTQISIAEAHRRAVSEEEHHVASPYTRHVIGETAPTQQDALLFPGRPRLSVAVDMGVLLVLTAVSWLIVIAVWLGVAEIIRAVF